MGENRDLFQDAGYGGARLGGYGSLSWYQSRKTGLSARLGLVHVNDDLREERTGLSLGLQLGVSHRLNQGITAHLRAEHTSNHQVASQYRLLGVFEFALVPEV